MCPVLVTNPLSLHMDGFSVLSKGVPETPYVSMCLGHSASNNSAGSGASLYQISKCSPQTLWDGGLCLPSLNSVTRTTRAEVLKEHSLTPSPGRPSFDSHLVLVWWMRRQRWPAREEERPAHSDQLLRDCSVCGQSWVVISLPCCGSPCPLALSYTLGTPTH